MNFLLKKENQHKIDLLTYLENSPLQTSSIKKISDDLSLSTFLIKKSLTQITDDLLTHSISGIDITVTPKECTLTTNGTNSILILKWIYIKQSTLFLLLDQLFKEEDFSLEDFSKEQFISLPSAYLLRSELELQLQPYAISIDSDFHLTGDEATIRSFLFNLYFNYFNSFELPFDDALVELTNKFIDALSDFTSFSYSPTQRLKVQFFLLITFQRLYHGQTFSINNDLLSFDTITFKSKTFIFNFFSNTTSLTELETKFEASFFLSFLYSENLIPKVSTTEALSFIKLNSPSSLNMTSYFLNDLKKTFHIPSDLSNYPLLKRELNRIHFKFLNFNLPNPAVPFSFNPDFLKENYPDFFIFIDSFIQSKLVTKEVTDALYYAYVFTLIKYIPLTILKKPIYICIDFSQGKSYNHFIATNIKSFKFLNIIIEKNLSSKTDLYMSDFKPSDSTVEFILWNNPPLPSDWEHFGNKIVELKNKKGEL